ncbi:NADPH--sulfite reductase flavoprotein alpha-component [Planctomycetales bacterium 10988]|nr:NADPH--sulfite reductase flavoprotein alpha-component [Planctomycetales bacterium 10988]
MTFPYFPEDAPFSPQQRQWLSGFFAGMNARAYGPDGAAQATQESVGRPLTILFGTQTGNAEGLAFEAAQQAAQFGLHAKVLDMGDFTIDQLPETERLLIITSTYGEGEMPDNAQALWDAAQSDSIPRLENTYFSILALGDTSYDLFCQAGKDWDRRLEELGAKRIYDRVDCDVDFDDLFASWSSAVLPAIAAVGTQHTNGKAATVLATPQAPARPKWNRKNPFPAKLLKNVRLTQSDSTKETRHYEISLEGSDLTYEVGDILNVMPKNDPQLVTETIEALGAKAETIVVGPSGNARSLYEVLLEECEIKIPSKDLLAAVAERSGDTAFQSMLAPEHTEQLGKYLWGRESVDLLLEYPQLKFSPEEFIALLKPLQARAYSISSSINAFPNQVHLTIASVRYDAHGRPRKGVCSTYLADRHEGEDHLPVYLTVNKHFGVPEDDSLPMIMVGPGTGVAPFRAFLQERQIRKAPGKNWLFFGERNRESDFFYKEELNGMIEDGTLNRLDLAFSRDQAEKIYVQNRMKEQGKELFAWLEEGGYFFVCGDAYRMAKDVDKALHEVIAEHGGMSDEQAAEYVNQMKKDKRYVRDVY